MTDQQTSFRILIVEDSLGVARSLALGLGLHSDGTYRVETCPSAEEALERLLEAPLDLLISDLRLPGIDGLTLLERTQHISPATKSILITAFGSPDVEERARTVANAYLAKPFLLQDLIRLVEHVLQERQPPPAPIPSETVPPRPNGEVKVKPAERKSVHLTVLACDLDGTLAEDGHVSPATWELLRMAKMAGLALILVTGRTLEAFIADGPYNELFEALVAENGAVVSFPRRRRLALPFGRLEPDLLQHLALLGVALERGVAIAATVVPHDEIVLRALSEGRHSASIEYNRNAIMLLPSGASKGNGLRYALDELGYSPHNVVACGDAENDRSMLVVAELGVAVANARSPLREHADVVLPRPNGAGVDILVRGLLDGKVPNRQPRADRQLLIGYRGSGSPVRIDPFRLVETNLGIFGASGTGKSWLAGLVAEELLKQKYQVCIIDPEGDYRSLGASPRTVLLGGPGAELPSVADVLNVAEWNNVSLVLDLSTYRMDERQAYMADFLRALRGLRARRGQPHYFLVDEIQSFCPPEPGALTDLFLDAMEWGGFSLISYRPSLVAPVILEKLDHLLLTHLDWAEETHALAPLLGPYRTGDETLNQLSALPKGHAYLCTGAKGTGLIAAAEVVRFKVSDRTSSHVRHLHKYLRAPLPGHRRFYFNQPGGDGLGSAANLWEFREQVGRVPVASLRYHLRNGDFVRWLTDVLHDEELARRVQKVAHRNLDGEDLRQALLEVVINRYEELES
ncbi:MAG: DUF5752 family protein [Anaerolineae bacterium]